MEARELFFSLPLSPICFLSMRQYKLVEGPFPPETVFTGEIGRLKSYEKQKPYVRLLSLTSIGLSF